MILKFLNHTSIYHKNINIPIELLFEKKQEVQIQNKNHEVISCAHKWEYQHRIIMVYCYSLIVILYIITKIVTIQSLIVKRTGRFEIIKVSLFN